MCVVCVCVCVLVCVCALALVVQDPGVKVDFRQLDGVGGGTIKVEALRIEVVTVADGVRAL